MNTHRSVQTAMAHMMIVGHYEGDYLHITDRKKDMIISGGFNVYPSEVEQAIWGHPAVQDCAVIGVPDEQWREAVKAVDFIAQLPRSPVGKRWRCARGGGTRAAIFVAEFSPFPAPRS